MKINKVKNPQRHAGQALEQLIKQNNDNHILLLLSGGSALTLLQYISSNVLTSDITISVLDERYTKTISATNFGKLQKTEFYTRARAKNCTFISSLIENNESMEAVTLRLEQAFKDVYRNYPQTVTITTQGIGSDGHTAGIFPLPADKETFKNLFQNPNHTHIGYTVPYNLEVNQRITVNLDFLQEYVDHSVVFAVGEEKQHALETTMKTEKDLHMVPARVLHTMQSVQLFTSLEL